MTITDVTMKQIDAVTDEERAQVRAQLEKNAGTPYARVVLSMILDDPDGERWLSYMRREIDDIVGECADDLRRLQTIAFVSRTAAARGAEAKSQAEELDRIHALCGGKSGQTAEKAVVEKLAELEYSARLNRELMKEEGAS